jgi:hypothetical protein
MEGTDPLEMLGDLERPCGASQAEISALQQWAVVELPRPYIGLLRRSNGVEGFVSGESYLILYAADQIPALNKASGVNQFAPGLLLIGSDGSDTGYAFDTRHQPMPVVEVPFVGMALHQVRRVGSDFEDFLMRLRSR